MSDETLQRLRKLERENRAFKKENQAFQSENQALKLRLSNQMQQHDLGESSGASCKDDMADCKGFKVLCGSDEWVDSTCKKTCGKCVGGQKARM